MRQNGCLAQVVQSIGDLPQSTHDTLDLYQGKRHLIWILKREAMYKQMLLSLYDRGPIFTGEPGKSQVRWVINASTALLLGDRYTR